MALLTRAALKTEPRFRNKPQNRDVKECPHGPADARLPKRSLDFATTRRTAT